MDCLCKCRIWCTVLRRALEERLSPYGVKLSCPLGVCGQVSRGGRHYCCVDEWDHGQTRQGEQPSKNVQLYFVQVHAKMTSILIKLRRYCIYGLQVASELQGRSRIIFQFCILQPCPPPALAPKQGLCSLHHLHIAERIE